MNFSFSDALNSITNWQFLQEPLYRWWLFLFAMMMTLIVWNGAISFMKG